MCGSPPGAPQLPQYPGLTSQQQTVQGQQTQNLNQYGQMVQGLSGQLGNNQNILQSISGLFNQDGSVNQSALSGLSTMFQQGNQASGAQGMNALNSLGGLYGQNGAVNATEGAYTNALQNGAPANQQIGYQQQQNFNAMKQQAAQQGINITGNDWQSAASNSTAGAKLIQNYQQNSNMQNQNYNLGYLNQLSGNLGQLTGAGATSANTGMGLMSNAVQNPVGMAQNSITNGQSALAPYLQNYGQGLSGMFGQLTQQQLGPYQQQMAQQQANYQAGMNSYNSGQSQLMGWANLGANVGTKLATSYMAS